MTDIPNSRTPEYRIYRQMLDRCYLTTTRNCRWYGAKGIVVCGRWRFGASGKTGYECFSADMGPRPEGLTLDRVDPFGSYNPGNCRWATWGEQAGNKREHYLSVADRTQLRQMRAARGERHSQAKMTDAQVSAVKALISENGRTSEIARRFGVSPQTISDIKAGRTWAHIQPQGAF